MIPRPAAVRCPDHVLVGALQIESELHQHPARSREPDIRPIGDSAQGRTIRRPDLLTQADHRQVDPLHYGRGDLLERVPMETQLPVDGRVRGEMGDEQVRGRNQRGDAFGLERGERGRAPPPPIPRRRLPRERDDCGRRERRESRLRTCGKVGNCRATRGGGRYLSAHDEHRPTYPRLPRVGHPRHDPPRPRVQRDQPGAGLPQLPGARRAQGSGRPRHPRRHQPVRHHLGRAAPARGAGAEVRGVVRAGGGSRARDHRHLRRDRGDDRHPARGGEPGRRGDRVRAVLRELRPRHDPRRRAPGLRPAGARTPAGPRSAGRRVLAPDPRHHRQHAEQSVRTGPDASRARGDRATSASRTTRSPSPTRSTSTSASPASTSRSRRCRACGSGRSRSAGRRRPSASPDGGWAGSSRRPAVTDAIRKVHDFLTVGAPAPLQEGVAVALDQLDRSFYTGLAESYRARRDLLLPALRRRGLQVRPTRGRVLHPRRLRRPLPTSTTPRSRSGSPARSGSLPFPARASSPAGSERTLVRFVFCKTDDVLIEAARRLTGVRGGERSVDDAVKSGLQR